MLGLSLLKIQLFLIVSSQAQMNDKVACLMKLLQTEHVMIQRKTAEDVFQILFVMCSRDLVDAL